MKTHSYDLYFASPFFNDEEVEREEFLIKKLRSCGFKVFSPKEAIFVQPNAPISIRKKAFDGNIKAIDSSLAVFAVTDGKDMGTIWEAGYAFGKGIPVIYFAETLGDKPFNLMLAQSGRFVFTSRDQITHNNVYSALYLNMNVQFRGAIE